MQSQRFRGVTTLENCLTGSAQMQAGNTDTVAVKRIQLALAELGYLPFTEEDGIFGDRTGRAVTAYKRDHDLTPDNPVIGTGTMGALDADFAWEPSDPDSPDSSTGGLVALAEQARDMARIWVASAASAVTAWPMPPGPGEELDLERTRYEDALRQHLHFSRSADEQDLFDLVMSPMTNALGRTLDELHFEAHDRSSFGLVSDIYEPLDMTPGLLVHITPPFRNVLTDVERAAQVLRYAVMSAYPPAQIMGFPSHRRYQNLTTVQSLRNSISWAAFCAACSGTPPVFRPEPRWYA